MLANIHISGSIFRAVASALEGARHRIHIRILRAQGLVIEGITDARKNLRALADDARKANVRGRVFELPLAAIDALKRDVTVAYKIPPGMVDEPLAP